MSLLQPFALLAAIALAASVRGGEDELPPQAPAGWPRTAPFRELHNVEGAWVDLVLAPVRPLAWSADGTLYAVNTHDASVAVFGPDLAPRETWAAPWGPVSLALWSAPERPERPSRDEVLVVCRGTLVLARFDRASGELRALLPLPAEPADILVRGARAWIACSALDQVVEVDLEQNVIAHVYDVPSKHPAHLAFDGEGVLVAPMFSGNNSVVDPGPGVVDAGPRRVLDLADPAVCEQPLRDEDLFRIDPATRSVKAVARAMGAVLFAHGVNPASGELWLLNTEANNKDPRRMGEPAIRGDVVRNRVSFAKLARAAERPVEPLRILDFDARDPESGARRFDATRAVAQPCALAFDARGHGFVAGLGSDNVTELDAAGVPVREWDVGSIPRALAVAPGGALFVYCWGANAIEVYDLATDPPARSAVLALGPDPTPEDARAGRRLFYSARNSQHGNVSCNSCHVDGLSDMLAWDLSDLPADDKGPLMTQIVRGLHGTQPFHWRGDRRDLEHFNRTFAGLLGGEPLDTSPGGEFADFRAFVLALANPANPREDPRRVVSDAAAVVPFSAAGPPSSATTGQRLYFENPTITGLTCQNCHALPAGTSASVRNVEPFALSRRTNFEPVSLLQSWRKEQPGGIAQHRLTDGRELVLPTLGSGFSATGLMFSLRRTTGLQNRLLTPQGVVDVVSYLRQLDSGLAPATQRGWLLGREDAAAVGAELASYLLAQADARNCDAVAFGTSTIEGEPWELRWTYDRRTRRFVPETRALAPVTLDFFVEQSAAGQGRNVFLGLPVGMGQRFGIDADMDELLDLDERLAGTDPRDPDSDEDGHPDGVELRQEGDPLSSASVPRDESAPSVLDLRLAYANEHVVKVQFDTDEPARRRVRLANEAGEEWSVASEALERSHTAILVELPAGTSFGVQVTVADSSGNERVVELAGGARTTAVLSPDDTVVAGLATRVLAARDGALEAEVDFVIAFKDGRPAPGHAVVARLYVDDVRVGEDLLGPLTDAAGLTTFRLRHAGLTPGDVLSLGVESVRAEHGIAPNWSMPDTPSHLRRAFLTYPGP